MECANEIFGVRGPNEEIQGRDLNARDGQTDIKNVINVSNVTDKRTS